MEPPCTLCILFNEVAMVPSKVSWFIFKDLLFFKFLRNPHYPWNFIIVIFSNISKIFLSNLSSFPGVMELFLSQIYFSKFLHKPPFSVEAFFTRFLLKRFLGNLVPVSYSEQNLIPKWEFLYQRGKSYSTVCFYIWNSIWRHITI